MIGVKVHKQKNVNLFHMIWDLVPDSEWKKNIESSVFKNQKSSWEFLNLREVK
jgi:hypothetical protein